MPHNKTAIKIALICGVLANLFSLSSYADDLSYLGGRVMEPDAVTTKHEVNHSAEWQVDYHHYFNKNFAWSFSYLNEGHITDRKRDGVISQLWLNLPLFDNRLALAVGAGPYRYYDTIGSPNISSANEHGWGAIYSASVTLNVMQPLFLRATFNRTRAPHATNALLFGAGIYLWDAAHDVSKWLNFYNVLDDQQTKNELTAFLGRTSHNSFADLKGETFALEYRRRALKYLDVSASWLYQYDPGALKRNGVATQVWLVHDYLDRHVTVGVGAGPYYFRDREKDREYNNSLGSKIGELVSGMITYRFTNNLNVKFIWNRVGTKYNHDTDDYLLGIGCSW